MKTQIAFDTETTGFDPNNGDRLVELGLTEMNDGIRTGRELHIYINPERSIPQSATDVHGITSDMVADSPKFRDIAQQFIDFVGDAELVAHNAAFDKKFINFELKKAGYQPIQDERFVDSLETAKKLFPGARNNLDALCKRYGISLDGREKHGALIDARLLADVWLEMNGGRQKDMMSLLSPANDVTHSEELQDVSLMRSRNNGIVIEPTEAELEQWKSHILSMKDNKWGLEPEEILEKTA